MCSTIYLENNSQSIPNHWLWMCDAVRKWNLCRNIYLRIFGMIRKLKEIHGNISWTLLQKKIVLMFLITAILWGSQIAFCNHENWFKLVWIYYTFQMYFTLLCILFFYFNSQNCCFLTSFSIWMFALNVWDWKGNWECLNVNAAVAVGAGAGVPLWLPPSYSHPSRFHILTLPDFIFLPFQISYSHPSRFPSRFYIPSLP